MEEDTTKSGEVVERNTNGTFKEGHAKIGGRPLGQRDYATIYREALIKLAAKNNKSPDDLEEEILSKGIASARGGDYRFYKDLLDRSHGTATVKTETKVELSGKVDLTSKEATEIAKKYEQELNKIEDAKAGTDINP